MKKRFGAFVFIFCSFVLLFSFTGLNCRAEADSSVSGRAFDAADDFELVIISQPTKTEYKAFEELSVSGLSAVARLSSGEEIKIPSGELSFVYQNGDSFRAGDELVWAVYLNARAEIPVRVEKAVYDTSSFYFENAVYVFDGQMHYPKLVGALPTGADGHLLEYSFSEGAAEVTDGKVQVSVSFMTKSTEYEVPSPIKRTVMISPAPISVRWGATSFVYDSFSHSPSAFAMECGVSVIGSLVDVGAGEALAVSENPNYYITNPRLSFEVVKAENTFLSAPEVGNCIEGEELEILANPRFGSLEFSFYADEGLTAEIDEPFLAGTYYLVVEVAESENYFSLRSNPIEFTVLAANAGKAALQKSDSLLFSKFDAFVLSVAILVGVFVVICSFLLGRRVRKSGGASFDVPESHGNQRTCGTVALGGGELVSFKFSTNCSHADSLISNSLAKALIYRTSERVCTYGGVKRAVGTDVLNDNFSHGERVDVNILKAKGLVPRDTAYIRIFAVGELDKPLFVYANDFSLTAVKMIALTGGRAIKISTSRVKK